MFTGIIEETGVISNISQTGDAIVMAINARKILEDVHFGDSISVNGVCLTVTSFTKGQFTVDIMPETVKATSLSQLKRGSRVNLERAMASGGRFGGHFVTGHVDGTGVIVSRKQVENAVYYEIETSPDIMRYIVLKGSVAVDGTSLTVFGVSDKRFTLSLIPHTLSETILGSKGSGDIVNIECDMIGKYVGHFLYSRTARPDATQKSNLSEAFLKDNGFI
ncbi:riboflavin synthase [Bacillus sp. T33-2]|uniref:riboflavin synthase n=1 Tax=Bacillus sp. T33-2 TaxID=2054168 RepID=UPI000C7626ED|nr:riboflavin synthase [Bacillus sp. T33-2]PLR95083.1 riboflavin synthase [Bacillus sp. T33-2]